MLLGKALAARCATGAVGRSIRANAVCRALFARMIDCTRFSQPPNHWCAQGL